MKTKTYKIKKKEAIDKHLGAHKESTLGWVAFEKAHKGDYTGQKIPLFTAKLRASVETWAARENRDLDALVIKKVPLFVVDGVYYGPVYVHDFSSYELMQELESGRIKQVFPGDPDF